MILSRTLRDADPAEELLHLLLAEPYATRHHFDRLNLAEMEQHLVTHNGQLELPQSYQQCREIFCLLLLTLEQNGLVDYPELYESEVALAEPALEESEENTAVDGQQPTLAVSLADQYHSLAEFFIARHDLPIPNPLRIRLAIEHLCFAVEAEGRERIVESLKAFWANRDYEIQRLFEPDRNEFTPEVMFALGTFISEQKDFLCDSKFPYAMVTGTLGYLKEINSNEPLDPTAIELGALLLFFGQTRDFENFSLHNVLFADGLEPHEIVELSFRLLRVHKYKNRALTTGYLPNPQTLRAVQEDCQRVLGLLNRLKFLDPGTFKSVA